MNAARILWAACALITSSNWAQANDECVVVAPNTLRMGSKETLAVVVSGRVQKVAISLERHRPGRGAFFQTTVDAVPGVLNIAELLVGHTDLPDVQLSEGDAMVKLKVGCGKLWTREVLLPVSASSADHLFLQTDKPIYHPGSRVDIRFIALNGSLAPTSSPFRLEIRNPQNVVLEVKNFNPEREIMLSHQFDLPKHTVLGEWALVMRYGHKHQQNTTTTFAVQKYVLPRFSVKLSKVNSYILPNFQNVTIGVRAKFVNQQPVRGFVSFRFSVKNEIGDSEEIGTSDKPKMLVAGDATYMLRREDVVAKLGQAKLTPLFRARARLVVEATVIEEATGLREIGRSENTVFSSSPYLVSTARSETSFKPGAKFYVTAEVKYANGEPAPGVPTRLTTANNRLAPMTHETNGNGVVTFLVVSRASDAEFKFKVETAHTKYTADQQASAVLTMKAYRDNSGKYIAIERKDPKAEVKSGFTYEVSLFKPDNSRLTSAHYVVLSRGRVLAAGKVITDQGVLDPKVVFTVTPEMTPSFRLLVVGIMDGQLVTDAVYVNAEPTCTRDSDFTLTRKVPDQLLEPGAAETFLLRGKPGTRVGLLGVDQAVYLLRRKDLLTRKKVFESMQAKDMGHGQDAGTKAAEALANSGVVMLASQGAYGERADGQRRAKREVKMDIVNEFKNETLRDCCSRGMRPDQFLRSCSEREEVLRSFLDDGSALYSEQCVEAFAKCCSYIEDNQAVARSNAGDNDVLGEGNIDDFQGQERRDFRETWIFEELTIDAAGEATYDVSVPDSITTWELSAVGVSPSGGICVINPLEVRVFKKLFVEINLPYSVVQNEQVEIPATVYNYDRNERKVRVAMLGTRDVCSGAKEGRPSSVRTVVVPAGQGRTVVFPVVPLSAGEKEIHVAAISDSSVKDAAKVTLRVEPPGVPKNESFNLILDPRNPQKRQARSDNAPTHSITETFAVGGTQLIQILRRRRSPQEVIPGSERCEIDIVGDDMGAALEASVKDPQNLLKMPSGCGEQTMINLAPTLYAYEYLKTADRISPADEDKALGFIRSGYQRMLTYRKPDGSFAVWASHSSSLWLTAFVVRTLCEAQKSIHVDENVITTGLRYIMSQQQQDGRFHDVYRLHHRDLLGGVDGPVPLTAYTLLTLQECSQEGVQVPGLKESFAKASVFIESELKPGISPYVLSLAAYALSFGNSPARNDALQRLRGILKPANKGGLHVSAGTEPLSVQATSYALMALLNAGESRDTVMALVQWLNLRMNPSGSLTSSQDTVVALQALSKYAIYARDSGIDLTCEVTLSADRRFNRTVRIRRENAQLRNRIEIPQSDDKIFVNVKGTGTATMYVVTSYEAPVGAESLCKFDLNATFTQTKVSFEEAVKGAKGLKESYSMTVCARSLDKDINGMAIVDVGLLTGFKPVLADLEKLVADKRVDSFEHSKRSVVLYLPPIPSDAPVCITFGLQQEFAVGKLQSGTVKVYAYYNPEQSCTKFYSPDSTSPLLKIDCNHPDADHSEMCECLEGGCPPEDVVDVFTKDENKAVMKTVECRENFRDYACEQAEFVWLGRALQKSHKNGFVTVPFLIEKVLKPGIESEEDLVEKKRTIKARDNCQSFNLTLDKQYIVMGMDAKYKEEDNFGDENYVYVIDSDSVVIPYPPAKDKGTRQRNKFKQNECSFYKLVNWFVTEFSDESKRCLT